MTRVIPRLLIVILPALLVTAMPPAECSAAAVSGQVVSIAGEPLAGVSVNASRGPDVMGSTQTAADGTYSINIAASVSFIDYIVYERAQFLPKVVEGPLWAKTDSRLNVVLLSSSITNASQAAALGAIHSSQFLQVIANRTLPVPEALVSNTKLAVAVRCLSGPAATGGGGGGGPERMKSVDRWGRDDDFFPVARSTGKDARKSAGKEGSR